MRCGGKKNIHKALYQSFIILYQLFSKKSPIEPYSELTVNGTRAVNFNQFLPIYRLHPEDKSVKILRIYKWILKFT